MSYLLGFGIPALYLMVAGFCIPKFYHHFWDPDKLNFRHSSDATAVALICSVLWVIALPVFTGAMLSTTTRETRTQRRHKRELTEAQHHAELARLKEEEHKALDREIALLERQRSLTSGR